MVKLELDPWPEARQRLKPASPDPARVPGFFTPRLQRVGTRQARAAAPGGEEEGGAFRAVTGARWRRGPPPPRRGVIPMTLPRQGGLPPHRPVLAPTTSVPRCRARRRLPLRVPCLGASALADADAPRGHCLPLAKSLARRGHAPCRPGRVKGRLTGRGRTSRLSTASGGHRGSRAGPPRRSDPRRGFSLWQTAGVIGTAEARRIVDQGEPGARRGPSAADVPRESQGRPAPAGPGQPPRGETGRSRLAGRSSGAAQPAAGRLISSPFFPKPARSRTGPSPVRRLSWLITNTQFSCLLDVGTPENAARALELYTALSQWKRDRGPALGRVRGVHPARAWRHGALDARRGHRRSRSCPPVRQTLRRRLRPDRPVGPAICLMPNSA